MTDPTDREAIRRRARTRAERMGLAVRPDPTDEDPAPEPLPTTHPGALRALLNTGHLTPGQAAAARAHLTRLTAEERQSAPIYDFPEDAA